MKSRQRVLCCLAVVRQWVSPGGHLASVESQAPSQDSETKIFVMCGRPSPSLLSSFLLAPAVCGRTEHNVLVTGSINDFMFLRRGSQGYTLQETTV